MSSVHSTHCCDKHGCKYGDDDCPVTLGKEQQEYPCETCGLTSEGYYGEGNDFGYYDSAMRWHPPDGSSERQREIEDAILAKAAAWFRREPSEEQKADPEKARMYNVACRVAQALERREFEDDGQEEAEEQDR